MVDAIKEYEATCRNFMRVIDSEMLHTGMEEHKSQLHDGTCEWSTNHPLFNGWKDSKTSSLLWVSADPGCGKSVLAKYLVDHVVPTTKSRMTCYFFFKADSIEQRSAVNALCALLRQLFLQRPTLRELHQWVPEKFSADRSQLINSFSALWDIMIKVTSPENEEVICILDALDECAGSDRPQLTQARDKLYRGESRKGVIKFLITSRPYDDVEANKIEREINLVIQKRVEETGAKLQLDEDERFFLRKELLLIPNRTYLWVTLIFDVIENSLSYTNKKVRKIIQTVPRTVDEAYERILNQSPDKEKARSLLHIVVGATRPLTIKEMRIALAMDLRHQEYSELDLEPKTRFATTVRNLCGLFVAIIDSKIYLLHQTAKEFLVTIMVTVARRKHSLPSIESNRILLEICMSYLLLDIFEHDLEGDKQDERDELAFLHYSANNWATHFRNATVPEGITALVACSRNMQPKVSAPQIVAEQVLAKGEFLLSIHRTDTFPYLFLTPLAYASDNGHAGIVEKLLQSQKVDVGVRDWVENTPLLMAARGGHSAVVRLLLRAPAIDPDCRNKRGCSPQSFASESGYSEVVRLLTETKAVQMISSARGDGPVELHYHMLVKKGMILL
ncbi:hypothetical protein BDV26DRAFT_278223 [Aspergillus bertholletiae]|uniref:NACHT domain-containing protein n=1 Tax=Aspergillus bertholletiae TaxID=1226010 RepID=A0A5N7BKB7_9EURO|nr:hypothetical protein BDV26DRAFT_278223 [Aspergillus bertholletiae]